MLEINKTHFGDCLEIMKSIDDKSIDLILCDLPYAKTRTDWDVLIDLDLLWIEYKRIIKDNRCIVLFGQQPFTSKVILSNIEQFKFEMIWEKSRGSNFQHSNYQPLKVHENIMIFSNGSSTFSKKNNNLLYNPQKVKKEPYNKGMVVNDYSIIQGKKEYYSGENKDGMRFPRSVYYHSSDSDSKERGLHPTQKPVALFEYLIKTFSNEGDLVLDNCGGSGTTGVASINTNRNFIMIENKKEYFDIINTRLSKLNKNNYE